MRPLPPAAPCPALALAVATVARPGRLRRRRASTTPASRAAERRRRRAQGPHRLLRRRRDQGRQGGRGAPGRRSSGIEAEVTVAADLDQQLSQGFAGDNPPDVFYVSTPTRFAGYADNGAL